MIVYRMMSKEELDLFIIGDMKKIGKSFLKEFKLSNNHKYKENEKYIHMFRSLKDMEYVQFGRDFEYIAIFNIPMIVLMSSRGKGLYKKFSKGKLKYKYVREFAIEAQKIKSEYFLGFEEVNIYEPNDESYLEIFKNKQEITKDDELVIKN